LLSNKFFNSLRLGLAGGVIGVVLLDTGAMEELEIVLLDTGGDG